MKKLFLLFTMLLFVLIGSSKNLPLDNDVGKSDLQSTEKIVLLAETEKAVIATLNELLETPKDVGKAIKKESYSVNETFLSTFWPTLTAKAKLDNKYEIDKNRKQLCFIPQIHYIQSRKVKNDRKQIRYLFGYSMRYQCNSK